MSAQPLSTFTALLEGKKLSQWNKHLTGVGCDATVSDPTRKLVFLSSGTYPADMRAAARVAGIEGKPKEGLEAADAVCQKLADDAGLGGIYMAWLPDDTDSPSTRFTQAMVSYQLVNGTSVGQRHVDCR